MKKIQPVQSWANGQVVEATILDAYAIQEQNQLITSLQDRLDKLENK